MLIERTDQGLYCAAGGFYVDPWSSVSRAVITHAHGDHLRPGSGAYLCSAAAERLVRHRLPDGAPVQTVPYGEPLTIGDVRVSFHPAGHVLGSAQVRVEHRGEVWVVSGDYKRAADPTCAPFEPVRCETFVTEATFALPIFRWAPPVTLVDELLAWWDAMVADGRSAVLFAYALGKAQRVLAELASRTDRVVYIHGALAPLNAIYADAGVRLAATRVAADEPRGTSFAGALVIAPVLARGTTWMRRFADHSSAFASGWMRIRGARRRRGYDRGFALSDHADWPALLETIAETGASRVVVTHGSSAPLVRLLQERGLEAWAWATQYEGEPEAETAAGEP